jgi:hypothetical protein
MKILCISNSPSAFHRIKLPMSKLNATFSTKLTEELFSQHDSVWFHYKINVHPTELSQWRLKYGTQIVLDIDDTWNIPLNHPSYKPVSEAAKWSKQFAIIADWVVCSTPEVESMVKPYNENTLVVPNRIPYGEGQYHVVNESKEEFMNRKIRIGFCGSVSHLEDWLSISNKFKRIVSEFKKEVEFVVCGYPSEIKLSEGMVKEGTDYAHRKGLDVQRTLDYMLKQHKARNKGLWDRILKVLGSPKVFSNRPVENYIDLYREIDILLCPLVDNDLNRKKSGLKIFEAACTDTLCILGEMYRDIEPCSTVHLFEDWYNNIRFLIKDKEKLYDMKLKTSEYIRNLYDYHTDCVLPRQSILGIKRQLDMNIWGITYKPNQKTEYKPYFNTINTVADKSYFFEANVMAKLFQHESNLIQ